MQEQRDAASEAHFTTLKVAYGDLDADTQDLDAWRDRKQATKSQLGTLDGQFSKLMIDSS